MLRDINPTDASADGRRELNALARRNSCAVNGRHRDVVLEAGEPSWCRYCGTSPLSRAELETVGVAQAPNTATVPRCCALDAFTGYAAAFTAVGDDAHGKAREALAAAEARHAAGHSSPDA